MKTFKEWCKELLPIVQAGANGEEIEVRLGTSGDWHSKDNNGFSTHMDYRIKPKTITVNGIEVPAPLTTLEGLDTFYLATPSHVDFYINYWAAVSCKRWLDRGLCHKTKEAAIAHAKAMCGIKE